ncbi:MULTISPECIES: ATP-binding cassette domain-containing protein [unclassified Haladaptatus]|uniref:ATP-binding cassette domain-containing protein n=1 Tax=unclassified Haladaptatus TaxID=2622732 RepID=UPI00209C56A3|nr:MULTISPECIES: ATP-binding cassette domain-containing protein [unclassified Haladaptatus]MCO8242746.1 ATP-binding cassette domain-containing protein [Haladaptatus sp. AB643]MCO8252505.1 ATP-binding cassette domain-containing protein [Haladaptatus sp. AB618]
MTDAIRAEDVHVVYPDGTEAVNGVDMRVPEGEFFGFLGPNGAGKTTTIRTLVTLLRPTDGAVTVNGYDVAEDPKSVRRSVGYMAQETSIDEELTARENVEYMAAAYGIPKSDRGERADELLDLADLLDVADKSAKTFSGGMKKRLDAVTALVHRPPVVFLDEPTTGLDPKARNRLWDYFREINREGTTVFLTTQYLEEADQLCDRISLIKDGEIDLTGSPDELKREVGGDILELELAPSDVDVATRIAESGDVFDDAVVTETTNGISIGSTMIRTNTPDYFVALRETGVEIDGFDVRSPTLDDVFLAVTGEGVEEEDAVESSTEVML